MLPRTTTAQSIFSKSKIFFDPEVSHKQHLISELIASGGNITNSTADATHIITPPQRYDLYATNSREKDQFIVTVSWLKQSLKKRALQSENYFSADPAKFLSGLTLSSEGYPTLKLLELCALVEAYGGRYEKDVTQETTHFVVAEKGPIFHSLISQHPTPVVIVSTRWLQECAEQKALLSPWRFPVDEGSSAQSLISDEPLFAAPKMAAGRPPSPTPAPASAPYVAPTAPVAPASRRNEAKLQKNLGPAERRTIAPASSTEKRPQSPSSSLAPSAELSLKGYTFAVANYDEHFTNYLRLALQHYGAEVHARYSSECTHLLSQFCTGPEYEQALREKAVIVTAYWLYDSIKQHKMLDPASRTLSFKPLTNGKPIPGLEGVIISFTGFRDETKERLRYLIRHCGAIPKSTLSNRSSYLVMQPQSEGPKGTKYERAKEWKIPCVVPKWFFDCARNQKLLSTAAYLIDDGQKAMKQPRESDDNSDLPARKHVKTEMIQNNAQM